MSLMYVPLVLSKSVISNVPSFFLSFACTPDTVQEVGIRSPIIQSMQKRKTQTQMSAFMLGNYCRWAQQKELTKFSSFDIVSDIMKLRPTNKYYRLCISLSLHLKLMMRKFWDTIRTFMCLWPLNFLWLYNWTGNLS